MLTERTELGLHGKSVFTSSSKFWPLACHGLDSCVETKPSQRLVKLVIERCSNYARPVRLSVVGAKIPGLRLFSVYIPAGL